jgi:type IV pilus assembly protein PilP
MMMVKLQRFFAYSLVAFGLIACSFGDQEDLQKWMTEQRTATKPSVVPIPEPKKFTPAPYQQEAAVEPFSNQKLTQALKRDSSQATANAALVAPELNRRKEPLEAFPLDSMALVGSLSPAGKQVALVRVDNLLYQVKVGNYLGQNYGKVTKVSETEVALREIVQDAAGEWIERQANLQLQERSK